MKVLFIVGTCLQKNTSANMSHNSYIRGLVENGCDVDVIMQTDSWGQSDSTLKRIEGVNYIEYESRSRIDKLRQKFSRANVSQSVSSTQTSYNGAEVKVKQNISSSVRALIKDLFYILFPVDKVYPLDRVWIKNAKQFKSKKEYDLVVSNSSPAASHKLAHLLIAANRIKTKRWFQIWEDPWYHDLYGNHAIEIKEEEQYLLNAADEIYYVSPLTTEYQKRFFPSAAEKMSTVALPYFDIDEKKENTSKSITYGYFGDYYSYTRNLLPVFNVLNITQRQGYIYGDSDLSLKSNTINISPRVTLDVLSQVQQNTTVLIHLSNLRGGQIPGKIYHYSATCKPILFILDGTPEEKEILFQYFGKLNRYYFCDNNEESISITLSKIEQDLRDGKQEKPLDIFSPKEVIKSILTK